jgi:HD-GYP domain-containing protein (c-di-GMP phosphodiesterase class II)
VKSITASCRKGSETGSTSTRWPVLLEHEVVGLGRLLEPDVVLEARAAAALDRHAQAPAASRSLVDLGQAGEGAVGDFRRQGSILWRPFPCRLAVSLNNIGFRAADKDKSHARPLCLCPRRPRRAAAACTRGGLGAPLAFQRDRDRIIHSTAFRRLQAQDPGLRLHEGDYYRTRLTHSIEVAQIARTLARQLALDEDLAEALALAHDLGHPPFGHAGEEALNGLMKPYGGFDHNAQALKA